MSEKLWMGKYKMRVNYDTFIPEVSVAGVWVNLEFVHESQAIYGEDKAIDTIREKYGDAVADEILNPTKECDHMYVWFNNTSGGQQFKCHECGIFRVM